MSTSTSKRKCFMWFEIRFTTYTILKNNGDYELVVNKGLISKHIEKIKLFKVLDVSSSRSIGQAIFGTGSIRLHSTDKSASYIEIENIHNYMEFAVQIERLAAEEKERLQVKYHETNII